MLTEPDSIQLSSALKVHTGDMANYKIQIPILVLTPRSKTLFLRWALEGFKFSRLPQVRKKRDREKWYQ